MKYKILKIPEFLEIQNSKYCNITVTEITHFQNSVNEQKLYYTLYKQKVTYLKTSIHLSCRMALSGVRENVLCKITTLDGTTV